MYRDLTRRIMAVVLSVCMIAGMVDLSGLTVRAAGISISDTEVTINAMEYTGEAIKPSGDQVVVTDLYGNRLVEGTDYTIPQSGYGENINAGMGSVTIVNTENEQDRKTVQFVIEPRNIETVSGITFPTSEQLSGEITSANQTYEPTNFSVTDSGNRNHQTLVGRMSAISVAGVDYTYSFENNTGAGNATLVITGRNNYTGTRRISFTISLLDNKLVKFRLKNEPVGGGTVLMGYTGEAREPEIDYVYYDANDNGTRDTGEDTITEYQPRYSDNFGAGEAKVWVVVTGGRYVGLTSETKAFNIRKSISSTAKFDKKIWASPIDPQSYRGAGQQVTLDENALVLHDPDNGDKPLKLGVDYEITGYSGNTEITKNAKVNIKGIGNYSDTRTETFEITATTLSSGMVEITGEYVYAGDDVDYYSEVIKNLTVKNAAGEKYEPGADYSLSQVDKGSSAGQHRIRITPMGRLTGDPIVVTYEVKKRPLSDPDVHLSIVGYTNNIYDGNAKKPSVKITYKNMELIAGTHYERELRYTNNINATTADSKAHVWAVAMANGNFSGETLYGVQSGSSEDKGSFEILPITLTEANAAITGILTSYTYTGGAITPTVNVVYNSRNTLRKDTDYIVDYKNNTNAGDTAEVTIAGTGNYTGTFTRHFNITRRMLSDGVTIVPLPSVQYTGSKLEPEVTIRYGSRDLVRGTDYELEYGDADHDNKTTTGVQIGSGGTAGPGIVTIRGLGNFDGTQERTFTITPRNIERGGTLQVTDLDKGYDFTTGTADQHFYPFTGNKITFVPEVSYESDETGILALTNEIDYTLDFSNNTEIGAAQVTIRAKGNFAGTQRVNFTIKGNLADYGAPDAFTKIEIPDQDYTGSAIVPRNAKVIFNGKELTERDFDITCTYGDNVDVGTARATIVGNGNYYGEVTPVEFTINPFDLSKISEYAEAGNNYVISNIASAYTFCDTFINIEPVPSITHNGRLLDVGAYRVEYGSDNKEVGEGTLTIYGTAPNYAGEHTIKFAIEPYDIEDGEKKGKIAVEGIEDVILDAVVAGDDENARVLNGSIVMSNLQVMYTAVSLDGTQEQPRELKIEDGSNGGEYTVFYERNTEIGEATITITGKGNFTGTITKTFRIRGDMSKTEISVADVEYKPTGNTPDPVVTYTYPDDYNGGKTVTLTLDEEYAVDYEDNADAKVKSGVDATVKVSTAYDRNGTAGNYVGENQATFEILQRDLSRTIETAGQEKDPLLNVTGLVEDGYEYNGSEIVPELQVRCDNMLLTADDYNISAVNNTDVYTFSEGENAERLMPNVTVSAVKDGDGNYTGNYKGEFQMEFKINPREISADTIRTLLQVGPNAIDDATVPEMDYTGEAITFPLVNPDDPSDVQNDIRVTWSKQGQSTSLVEKQDYTVLYEDNTRIGEAKIIVKAMPNSNYTGEYRRIFKIMASIEVVDQENPPLKYMTLTYDHNVPFGVVNVYPDMIFIDVSGGAGQEPKILVEGEDFEVVTQANQGQAAEASRNNRNVATETAEEELRPTVVIRGIGCYRGVIKRYYNITPKNLATDQGDITITFDNALNTEDYENAFIYNGSEITPTVKVYNHGELMQPGEDYTVAGYLNNTAISTEARKAGIIIRAVDGGNYLNQKTFYFNIIRRPIEGMQAVVTGGPQVYSRKGKTPDVEVSYMEGTERITLTKGKDYDVAYENNVVAATEYAGEDAPVAIITGKGSYGGTLRKTFTIEPESFDESNDDFNITAASAPYTGMEAMTTLTVQAKDRTPLEEGVDYEVGGYQDNINAGTGYVTIRGIGNYTGSRLVPFNILPVDVAADFLVSDIPEQVYTGREIRPQVEVSLVVEEQEIPLTENDYEVVYQNNVNAGTATAIIKGAGNFSGEKRINFTITPKSIGTEEGMDADMILADVEDQPYTGRGVTPDVSLKFRCPAALDEDPDNTDDTVTPDDGNELLIQGRDYTLTYFTNVAVGTASVVIVGIGNYTGSIQTQFRILGGMNLADVAKIEVQPYTGNAVTPKPQITYAGETLIEGEDYTLEYADNVAQGTATITITGIGRYTGTKTVTFEIARDFSAATVVKGLAAAYTYTGKAITPAVLVEDHGNILSNGTDYRVSYKSNINVGTATVTITGINRYDGTVSATFKITPQNIGGATAAKIPDQTYDGKNKKPSVTITSNGIALRSGTDYTVVHEYNKNPGKASVVLRGKGNYTGTKTINYNIKVPKVTGVRVSSYSDNSITFAWNRNKVVSGYEIYNSKNKKVAFVDKNSTLKATVVKLSAGKTATYRVRAFVNKGQYYYSEFVSIKAGTAPKKTKITSLTSTKSKQAVIKWKKIKGATQYQVYRSTKLKGKYKKIATTTKTSYTDKKATGGKTYYYKIRVGKKNGSKTYYSSYSSIKSIAAKK